MIMQIKSKQRVTDYGEVFTSEREVQSMLDLVKQETDRIESCFLEPSCGTGNFLIEILRRKLAVVEGLYANNRSDYDYYTILAVSSIYGVEILEDNVLFCRKRLFDHINEKYYHLYKIGCPLKVQRTIQFILERNIIWGDFLTMRTVDGEDEPFSFVEWSDGIFVPLIRFDHNPLIKNYQFPVVTNELQP
jgi:hypothetical protein